MSIILLNAVTTQTVGTASQLAASPVESFVLNISSSGPFTANLTVEQSSDNVNWTIIKTWIVNSVRGYTDSFSVDVPTFYYVRSSVSNITGTNTAITVIATQSAYSTLGANLATDANSNVTGIVNLATSGGNNIIMALGDSISAIGITASTTTTDIFVSDLSYLYNAVSLSVGQLTFGGVSAVIGYRTDQIISLLLPAILTAKPKYCVVHAGTNDTGTLTFAQTKANLLTIYQTLLANGITPIATSMLPKSTLTGASSSVLQLMTAYIAKTARNLGIPYCNWSTSLFNADGSGTWVSIGLTNTSYSNDGTHPSNAGAVIMGTALWNTIKPYISPESNYIAQVQNNSNITDFFPTTTNALQITNTSGLAFGYGSSTATNTVPAMSASEGIGNWQTFVATTTNHFITGAANSTLVKGAKYLLAFKYKTAGMIANTGNFKVVIGDGSNNADIVGISTCNQDITLGMFYREFIMPNTAGTTLRIQITINCAVSGASLSIGQPTLINLTANGLDTQS